MAISTSRSIAMVLFAAILTACGDNPPTSAKGEAHAKPIATHLPNTTAQAASRDAFTCDAPNLPHDAAAFDALIKTLPTGAVVDQGGEEGQQDYTLYPNDHLRTLEITIGPTANSSLGTFDLTAETPQSAWTFPGGLKIGAPIDEVEKALGGPFKIWLAGDGGTAPDALGGALAATATCRYWFNLKSAAPLKGQPRYAMSNDADVRAMNLRLDRFGLSHVHDN